MLLPMPLNIIQLTFQVGQFPCKLNLRVYPSFVLINSAKAHEAFFFPSRNISTYLLDMRNSIATAWADPPYLEIIFEIKVLTDFEYFMVAIY